MTWIWNNLSGGKKSKNYLESDKISENFKEW